MSPEEYLRAGSGKSYGLMGRPILYYPGAGSDCGPIDLLISSTFEGAVAIYADYCIGREEIDAVISRVSNHHGKTDCFVKELMPQDFGVQNIKSFYPSEMNCTEDEWHRLRLAMAPIVNLDWFGCRVFFCKLNLTLIYVKAEAVQTIKILQRNKITPDLVVLEDSSFGGAWTKLGGDSELYKALKEKPLHLYVTQGTEAWPGYKKVSESRVDESSCHRLERCIYSRE